MIDRLEVIPQPLAADGQLFLDDQICLDLGEAIALDRVGRIGQFEAVAVVEAVKTVGEAQLAEGATRSNKAVTVKNALVAFIDFNTPIRENSRTIFARAGNLIAIVRDGDATLQKKGIRLWRDELFDAVPIIHDIGNSAANVLEEDFESKKATNASSPALRRL